MNINTNDKLENWIRNLQCNSYSKVTIENRNPLYIKVKFSFSTGTFANF